MSDNSAPVLYRWDGDAMIPAAPRFAKQCDKQFVVGLTYTLVPHEQRSSVSHRHYFAAIQGAWENLPEVHAGRFRTSEHLRKWALVQSKFCDERTIVAPSKADALRIAAFVQSIDEYAVVLVRGNIVAHYTAKSQSLRAMDKKEFQESKQAVLDICANLIGVDVATLQAQSPPLQPAHSRERKRETTE